MLNFRQTIGAIATVVACNACGEDPRRTEIMPCPEIEEEIAFRKNIALKTAIGEAGVCAELSRLFRLEDEGENKNCVCESKSLVE